MSEEHVPRWQTYDANYVDSLLKRLAMFEGQKQTKTMTPYEHAKRIVEIYVESGLGDPHQSTDHAVSVSVAYLDLWQRLAALEAQLAEKSQE